MQIMHERIYEGESNENRKTDKNSKYRAIVL
jgi:hypothetical protein